MKKEDYKNIIKIFVCIICLAGFIFIGKHASAASASISVTTENKKVVKGDTVYVIITVKSSDLIGGFKGTFSYDSSVLKYVTGGSVMSGNDNEFYLTDTERETGVNRIKYSIKFIARHEGSVSIRLKKPYAIYKADDSSVMSVSYNSLNLMVVNKKDYEQKATPAPTDNTEQEVQDNEKKDNSANEKSDKKEKTPKKKNESDNTDKKAVITASYNEKGIVIHASDNYTVEKVSNSIDIPAGFTRTNISINGHIVDVYAPEGSEESDYVLIYCSREGGQPEFYLYDAVENQFMPYEKVKKWYSNISDDEAQSYETSEKSSVTMKYIITCVIIFVLAVFFIYIYLHQKRKKHENEDTASEIFQKSKKYEDEDNKSEIFDNFSGGHSWKRHN